MEGRAYQLDLEILFFPSASAFWLWDLRQGSSLGSTIYQTGMVMMTPASAGWEISYKKMYALEAVSTHE